MCGPAWPRTILRSSFTQLFTLVNESWLGLGLGLGLSLTLRVLTLNPGPNEPWLGRNNPGYD